MEIGKKRNFSVPIPSQNKPNFRKELAENLEGAASNVLTAEEKAE
jgi:hypothetical protein